MCPPTSHVPPHAPTDFAHPGHLNTTTHGTQARPVIVTAHDQNGFAPAAVGSPLQQWIRPCSGGFAPAAVDSPLQ
eukprot:7451542-Pyramimonas_sp.AAC.1